MNAAPSWDEVDVGMTVGPHAAPVTEDLVRDYCAALGVEAAIYLSPDDGGPAYMPPLLPAAWYIYLLRGRLNLGYGLMARHDMQAHAEVAVGEVLTATGVLADKYERKGRHYIVLDYEMRGQDGSLRQSHRLTTTVD